MKQLDPKVMATLDGIGQLLMERYHTELPTTYNCPDCLDVGYTMDDQSGQIVAKRCAPCLAREKAEEAARDKTKVEKLDWLE